MVIIVRTAGNLASSGFGRMTISFSPGTPAKRADAHQIFTPHLSELFVPHIPLVTIKK